MVTFTVACQGKNGGATPAEVDNGPDETQGVGPDGGTAQSSNGKASIVIPPGALTSEVLITIAPSTREISGNIGAAYEFGPDGTTFLSSVTLSLTYEESTLPQGTGESDLRLGKFVDDQWQLVPDSTINTAANQVIGTTTSFSTYGVITETTPTGNQSPIPSFTALPNSGNPPLMVSFDASASSDPDGTIAQYNWTFGDSQTGSGIATSHSYSSVGIYTVTLTLTDNNGATATATQTITVAKPIIDTISGTIFAPEGTAIDSDVNDPSAPYASNDSPAEAQVLPNPVMLGGYASFDGTGFSEDVFGTTGDVQDWYRATLAQGQTITLFISDHDPDNLTDIDLDLYLYKPDDTSTPIALSNEFDQGVESITLDSSISSDEYYILVEAWDSPTVTNYTNYILTIGQSPASVPQNLPSQGSNLYSVGIETGNTDPLLDIEHDFVPGEVVVRFKDNSKDTLSNQSIEAHASSLGLRSKRGKPDGPMLLGLGSKAQQSEAFKKLGLESEVMDNPGADPNIVKLQLKYDTIQVIKALRARSDIKTADPNYILKTMTVPNDEHYPLQWHYPLINLPQAWDITTGTPASGDVIVAVVDTGVFMGHSDLTGNLLSTGYDFISNSSSSLDGDGIDPDPDDPGDSQTPGSSSFHGTHVAGTIAASSNNTIGVSAVSWGAKILPIRVLGKGGGTSYDVLQGVRYAAGLSNDSGIILAQPADIINLSLGGGGFSQTAQDTFTEARNAGLIVIAAAGNENSSTLSYPASYDGVISVSAVDMQKNRAPYSNFGTAVDVAAPGGDTSVDDNGDGYADGVLSTLVDDSQGPRKDAYVFYQGTSMATPHMAGVVALMKAIYPGLTPDELDSALTSGLLTEDLAGNGGSIRDNNFGYGLIDALKAVQVASNLAGSGPLPPVLTVSPNGLNFGAFQNSLALETSNAGGGSLSITNVSDDANWLSVSATTVDPSTQLGTYTATVDRTSLVDTLYNATITFTTDTAGTVTVPVTMRVGPSGSNGNAGFHYVLLIDPVTLDTVDQLSASSSNGQYDFSFTNVPAGSYFILAGSDSDNDFLICDAGEACGGYPSLDQFLSVNVPGDTSGLNFETFFRITLSGSSTLPGNIPREGFSRLGKK